MTDDDLRYELFAMTLTAEERARLARYLDLLVTRDGGGWTIPDLSAEDFVREQREHLRQYITDNHADTFPAEE